MREFWEQHRKVLVPTIAVLLFLVAGLLVRALPGVGAKLMDAERRKTESAAPRSAASQTAARATPESVEEEALAPQTVRRSAGTTGGVSVLSVEKENEDEAKAGEWYLYITGSVRKPGVYKLPEGARLFQLVEAAGGLNNFADSVAVNMAASLADGMHVHIPKKGEREDENAPLIVEPLVVPGVPRAVTPGGAPLRMTTPLSGRNIADKIDINRATAEELTALKGIGPVLARSIVDYRQKNGRFRNVEDLLQVRGIGEKKLEGFRDSVTAGP